MDWQDTIRDMTNKGLIKLGAEEEGEALLAKLRQLADKRNKFFLLSLLLSSPTYSQPWWYWQDYLKANKN